MRKLYEATRYLKLLSESMKKWRSLVVLQFKYLYNRYYIFLNFLPHCASRCSFDPIKETSAIVLIRKRQELCYFLETELLSIRFVHARKI